MNEETNVVTQETAPAEPTEIDTLSIVDAENDPFLPEGWSESNDIFDTDSWGSSTPEVLASEPAETAPTTEQVAQVAEPAAEEPTEAAPTTEPEAVVEPEEAPRTLHFKYRYDHEDHEADVAEADLPDIYQRSLATQRAQDQLKAKGKIIDQLEDLARANGYSSGQEMLDAQYDYQRNEQIEKLVSEGTPRVLAEDYVNRNFGPARQDAAPAQTEATPAAEQSGAVSPARDLAAEIEQLWTTRPDLQGKPFPEEVSKAVLTGVSFSDAYAQYEQAQQGEKASAAELRAQAAEKEAERLRQENLIYKQNAEAAAKAPVTPVTSGGSTNPEPEDPFIRGWNYQSW